MLADFDLTRKPLGGHLVIEKEAKIAKKAALKARQKAIIMIY